MNPLIPTPADVALIVAFLVPIAAAIWVLGLWLSLRRRRRRLLRTQGGHDTTIGKN